jgi:hypothetical protein
VRSFQERIERVLHDGQLTIMDLSRWFERAYPTVRTWHLAGHEPWGPHGEDTRGRLEILETAIKRKQGFPVPTKLSPRARRAHIERIRDDVLGRISPSHSSR